MPHARKILSQSGTSLADVYEIEGSIVGVEELDAQEVKTVHEMGGQIFSERLQQFFIRMDNGDVLQSVAWDISAGAPPDSPNRILSISVHADVTARVSFCSIALSNFVTKREQVIWAWDSTIDNTKVCRWRDDAGAVANTNVLQPVNKQQLPALMIRTGDAQLMPHLLFRGQSLAFGAGNVECIAIVTLARANTRTPGAGEPSSHGLPLPSW